MPWLVDQPHTRGTRPCAHNSVPARRDGHRQNTLRLDEQNLDEGITVNDFGNCNTSYSTEATGSDTTFEPASVPPPEQLPTPRTANR